MQRYFGPEARIRLIDHGFKKWDDDPWSWGGSTATTRHGVLTRFDPALRQPVGEIHWAGIETADYWQEPLPPTISAQLVTRIRNEAS